MDGKYIDRMVTLKRRTIKAMEKHPLRNYIAIRKEKVKLQALEEAGRDVLNTRVTNGSSVGGVVDKNNYATYEKQVEMAYEMYDCESEYGAELMQGLIETRISFIVGEGLSVTCNNKATEDYINRLITTNKLNGSRLCEAGLIGELEGKCLMLLLPDAKTKAIKIRNFSWRKNKYTVTHNPLDTDDIKSITYKTKKTTSTEATINTDKAVYVRLGGSGFRETDTPNRVHSVLTDIENFSRAKYDLRNNTHLFGKVMPYWKTATQEGAQAINNGITDRSWEIGDGYAGSADFSLVEPSGNAGKSIIDDMLISLKCISVATSIPVHWLAWPELMSNRATAESLVEVIAAGTKKERLLWEEAFTELFKKACILAVDNAFEKNIILKDLDTLVVTLPMISMQLLKQLAEVWQPLYESDIISLKTYRNKIPGINPAIEEKTIIKEQKEAAKNSPFANTVIMPNGEEIEDDEDTDQD